MTTRKIDPSLHGVNPHIVKWCENAEARLAAQDIGTPDWNELSLSERLDRLGQIVGNTPLAPVPELPGISVKEEFRNPAGSHYDRAAYETFRQFIECDYLHPGDKMRDITTGSAGISFPFFARLLGGNPVRITHPDELPASRTYPMRRFGAEVINAGPGYIQVPSDKQKAEILELVKNPQWSRIKVDDPGVRAIFFQNRSTEERICYPNHSENDVSVLAHQKMAEEMVRQMVEPPNTVTLAEGNFTTITGIVKVLRKHWPETKIFGVIPSPDSPLDNFGMLVPDLNIPLRFRNPMMLDGEIIVSHDEREAMRARVNAHRRPAERIGNSSLLVLSAAERMQREIGGTALTVEYDLADRYKTIDG